jgi:hypothetical protein
LIGSHGSGKIEIGLSSREPNIAGNRNDGPASNGHTNCWFEVDKEGLEKYSNGREKNLRSSDSELLG